MYALRLLKKHSYMERRKDSKIMCMVIDTCLDVGTILPICIDNFIVSEAKVVDSNIFQSRIKIVLCSDKELIPQFTVFDTDTSVNLTKSVGLGTTEYQMNKLLEVFSKQTLHDVRPCTIQFLKLLVSDLFDYVALSNLQLNVRFK